MGGHRPRGRPPRRRGEDGLNIAQIFESFAHIVWPARCPVCGALGRAVCEPCLRSLIRAPIEVCFECGRVIPCSDHPGAIKCSAATSYEGTIRKIVHDMKYNCAEGIAPMIGRAIADCVPRPDARLLVPVPLHGGSRRDYNQAALIAGAAGREWGIPALDCLAWSRNSKRQALKADRAARVLPEYAIIAKSGSVDLTDVCLVDDIRTTGSTLMAARTAVCRAGGSVIGAVVWSLA